MPGPIQSIERAAAIMTTLERSRSGVRLTDLAAMLGLARSTTHGLLATLLSVGFVQQDRDTGRYRIGSGLPGSGRSEIDPNLLRGLAMTWADSLAVRTGQSVYLAVPQQDQAVIVHHVFRLDNQQQALATGSCLPLDTTAPGKVMLAYLPELQERFPATGSELNSPRSDPSRLTTEIAQIQRQGWYCDAVEGKARLASIAAPIRGRAGRVTAALAVTGPIDEILTDGAEPTPTLVAAVRTVAARISDAITRVTHRPAPV